MTPVPSLRLATRRLAAARVPAALLLFAALALPATVVAHHPGGGAVDPRCAEWTANGPPAGIDLELLCLPHRDAPAAPTTSDGSRLLPYAGGALVFALVLGAVGVLATRLTGGSTARPRAVASAWWACGACASLNAADRTLCYSCRAPAPADPGSGASAPSRTGAAAS